MTFLLNIDVPDVGKAATFYTEAFGLTVGRRFGADFVELLGWPAPVYLLTKQA
ncbi:glyoxalase, partial [Bradyrhizobium genomosp. I (2014)]